MKQLSPPLAIQLASLLVLLASSTVSLRAEDVYVTSGAVNKLNTCPPSCPYDLGPTYTANYVSTACTNDRTRCAFSSTNTATWKVAPTLANSHGTYRIFVTKAAAGDCSPDIIVSMTATNGTLADANGSPQPAVLTSAFQKTNSNHSWTLVGYIANNTNRPEVYFTCASGTLSSSSRWYMDAVYFQSVDVNPNAARITQILYSNSVLIAGTGPVSHPFALVSSTNATKALDQWTPEQTNTDNTGSFTFSITPGVARAGFFQVITQ
jgi:hypothetical protein